VFLRSYCKYIFMLVFLLGGCRSGDSDKQLPNGYSYRSYLADDGTRRRAVYLSKNRERRLITECVVVDEVVLSLMPTVSEWASIYTWDNPIQYIDFMVVPLYLNADGSVLFGGKVIPSRELSSFVSAYSQFGGAYVVLTIEPPVALSYVAGTVECFSAIASGGLEISINKENHAGGGVKRGRSESTEKQGQAMSYPQE